MEMLARVLCFLSCALVLVSATYGGGGGSSNQDDTTVLTNVCEDGTQNYKSKCECNCDCPTEDEVCPPTSTCPCADGSCLKCVVCDTASDELECNVIGHEVECCSDADQCLSEMTTSSNGEQLFTRRCARRDECPKPEGPFHRWENFEGSDPYDPRTATKWCQSATCNPWGCAAYVNSRPDLPYCSNDINQKPMYYAPWKASDFTQGNCRCDSWCWEPANAGGGGGCDCCPDFFEYPGCNQPYGQYEWCNAQTTCIRDRNGDLLPWADVVTLDD